MSTEQKKAELVPFTAKELLEMNESDFKQLKWAVGRFIMAFGQKDTFGDNTPCDPSLVFDVDYLKQTGVEPSDAWSQVDSVVADLKTRGYINNYGHFIPSSHSKSGDRTFHIDCGDEEGVNKEGFYRLHDEIIAAVKERQGQQSPREGRRIRFDWVITKTEDGKYFYQGEEIIISLDTDPGRALDALIEGADKNGIVLSSKIDRHMVMLGSKRIEDDKKRNTRISHSIGAGQGFLRHGLIGKKKESVIKAIGDVTIVRSLPGRGYQLINP